MNNLLFWRRRRLNTHLSISLLDRRQQNICSLVPCSYWKIKPWKTQSQVCHSKQIVANHIFRKSAQYSYQNLASCNLTLLSRNTHALLTYKTVWRNAFTKALQTRAISIKPPTKSWLPDILWEKVLISYRKTCRCGSPKTMAKCVTYCINGIIQSKSTQTISSGFQNSTKR